MTEEMKKMCDDIIKFREEEFKIIWDLIPNFYVVKENDK